MSAFMCSEHHFRVLATAVIFSGVEWRSTRKKSASTRCEQFDRIARILATENAKSVNFLYAHHNIKEKPAKHYFGGKDAAIGDDNTTPNGAVWCVDKLRGVHSVQGVTLQRIGGPIKRYNALAIYKALQCYAYQSCEHPQWPKSEAFRMCEAATAYFAREAIHVGLRAEYDLAAWAISE